MRLLVEKAIEKSPLPLLPVEPARAIPKIARAASRRNCRESRGASVATTIMQEPSARCGGRAPERLTKARGSFLDRAVAGLAQGVLDVLGFDVEPADVVEPPVVGLTDHGIDAPDVLVAWLRQGPSRHGSGGVPHAERVGQHDGRFDLAELVYLRGADQLAEGVVDVDRPRDFVLKEISTVRENGGNPGANVRAVDDAYLANQHSGNIGDGVLGPRIVEAGMDS